jgi:hypothetical protein
MTPTKVIGNFEVYSKRRQTSSKYLIHMKLTDVSITFSCDENFKLSKGRNREWTVYLSEIRKDSWDKRRYRLIVNKYYFLLNHTKIKIMGKNKLSTLVYFSNEEKIRKFMTPFKETLSAWDKKYRAIFGDK